MSRPAQRSGLRLLRRAPGIATIAISCSGWPIAMTGSSSTVACAVRKIRAASATSTRTTSDLPGDAYRGVSLRTWDPESGPAGRSTGSTAAGRAYLFPPVHGGFVQGHRHILRRRRLRGPTHPRALSAWSRITEQLGALGAGLLARRRQQLGDQLVHGFHESVTSMAKTSSPCSTRAGPIGTIQSPWKGRSTGAPMQTS